ncbi:MAG: SAM-dependent methyltransferase, partial [Acidimicrobiia bacterium]
MTDAWDADWWISEVATDPAFREDVLPLLIEMLEPRPGHAYLDLGCGEGQGMRAVTEAGAAAIGCDQDPVLITT